MIRVPLDPITHRPQPRRQRLAHPRRRMDQPRPALDRRGPRGALEVKRRLTPPGHPLRSTIGGTSPPANVGLLWCVRGTHNDVILERLGWPGMSAVKPRNELVDTSICFVRGAPSFHPSHPPDSLPGNISICGAVS